MVEYNAKSWNVAAIALTTGEGTSDHLATATKLFRVAIACVLHFHKNI